MTRPAQLRQVEGAISRSILIIEDDLPVAELFRHSLQSAGFDVTVTITGSDGLRAARRNHFAAIVLDIRLSDVDGLQILRMVSAEHNAARVVVVSGCLTPKVTAEAFRAGADEVLEKPVTAKELVTAVTASLMGPDSPKEHAELDRLLVVPPVANVDHSIAHRWARDVVNGCIASQDSKTLASWARSAGTSTTMISERCGMLDIKPHDARDLMRALFAMLASDRQGCPPHVLLDIADGRTLRSFRRKAGPDFRPTRDIDAINRFLDSQCFVAPHSFAVRILRMQLAKRLSEEIASIA
jgi:ActR/RegA family two-component response regulator